jgi:hypothetical protein
VERELEKYHLATENQSSKIAGRHCKYDYHVCIAANTLPADGGARVRAVSPQRQRVQCLWQYWPIQVHMYVCMYTYVPCLWPYLSYTCKICMYMYAQGLWQHSPCMCAFLHAYMHEGMCNAHCNIGPYSHVYIHENMVGIDESDSAWEATCWLVEFVEQVIIRLLTSRV